MSQIRNEGAMGNWGETGFWRTGDDALWDAREKYLSRVWDNRQCLFACIGRISAYTPRVSVGAAADESPGGMRDL